jgi:hypothetical protein
MSAEPRFDLAARCLHWLTAAVLMAVVIVAGIWIHYFEPADRGFQDAAVQPARELRRGACSGWPCVRLVEPLALIRRRRCRPATCRALIRLAAPAPRRSALYALLVLMPDDRLPGDERLGLPAD